MRKKILNMVLLLLVTLGVQAQWITFDPSNLAQSIVNSTKQVLEASTTAKNMVNNFQETVKIYEQAKGYYDALKSVKSVIQSARKVQQSVLMVGEISDIYVNNFNRMMKDENFTVDELSAIAFGYTKILQESSYLLEDLKQVTTSSNLSMNDKERMDIIDSVYNKISHYRNLATYYTRKNISISYLRSKESGDAAKILALYGSQDERYW